MAASPKWKVYDRDGKYQAACKEVEAAAVLATFYGEGSTIRADHTWILWTEGTDGNASDSYDETAQIVYRRLEEKQRSSFEKQYGKTQATT